MAKRKDAYADALSKALVKKGVPKPETEHPFHPTRDWRFDLAWPDHMIAVEIEGWAQASRHTSFKGFEGDCEKYNAAQLLGWIVLRFTTEQLRKGKAVEDLVTVFHPNRQSSS